jgi:hypothetical protein
VLERQRRHVTQRIERITLQIRQQEPKKNRVDINSACDNFNAVDMRWRGEDYSSGSIRYINLFNLPSQTVAWGVYYSQGRRGQRQLKFDAQLLDRQL